MKGMFEGMWNRIKLVGKQRSVPLYYSVKEIFRQCQENEKQSDYEQEKNELNDLSNYNLRID
ncbi:hypothetical protein NUSPORA_02243 [Nucleospora cyclopteri]